MKGGRRRRVVVVVVVDIAVCDCTCSNTLTNVSILTIKTVTASVDYYGLIDVFAVIYNYVVIKIREVNAEYYLLLIIDLFGVDIMNENMNMCMNLLFGIHQ